MPAQPVPPPQVLPPPPFLTRRVLPNGLVLLIEEDHSQPLAAFQAVVQTGSATEGPLTGSGVSHVVEHMLFKGTKRRAVGELEREARRYGGTTQGFTTYDTTSYQVVVNREFWSEAADLLQDALFSPSMDPGEFSKEREVVLRELKLRRDDPDQITWDLLFENAYRVHPYGVPIIGREPLLRQLTREEVFEYHKRQYLPNRTVIAAVGDFQAEEVTRRIEELFSGLPPGTVSPAALPVEPEPVARREVLEEAPVMLAIAAIGFPGVSINDSDLFALDLLAELLGGGRGSRLESRLKETGIIHQVGCWDYTPRERGLFVVSMRMDPVRIHEAVETAFEELIQAAAKPFEEEKLQEAKRVLLRQYLNGRQSVSARAGDFCLNEALTGDPLFSQRYLEEIQKLTSEEVRKAAQKYLNPRRSTVVKVFPRGELPSRTEGASADPQVKEEKVVLENGLRLILREDPRLPLVTFQISLKGGVRHETPKTNGLSQLASRMLLRGTRRWGAEELTDRIQALGAQVDSFSGRNSFGITLEVVRSEASSAAGLLAEIILGSAFRAEELEKERRICLAEWKAKEENPFSWGMRRLMSTLFSVHPYRFDPAGDPKVLSRLGREDLIRFHSQACDPQAMVVTVVGDFKREELLPLLQNSFGRISPSKGSTPSIPAEPVLTALRERLEPAPRQEGLCLIGFPGLRLTDPRSITLDLIEAILSGGAGRLFGEIRERRGLAYTVGAFSIHGVDPGAFVLYALTEPSQIPAVRLALLEEVRRISETPVPEEELRQAKQGLLGNRRIGLQSQSARAAQMSSDELLGRGWDFSREYERLVEAVRPEEIQALAKSLLDPKRCAVLVAQPAEKKGETKPVPGETIGERDPLAAAAP
ncbi:MAG: insulinase family protein [Candidatus Omnitrophica bacterium]|nr:insulinase family protein [Candidatus Omnitrophota bacterium]